ncbi:hypothetical protein ANRL4_03107 [Anaerolineae bacterium]|nr:hypothetical protein ANRL4_03107 [Anaerolineae bacterium]
MQGEVRQMPTCTILTLRAGAQPLKGQDVSKWGKVLGRDGASILV